MKILVTGKNGQLGSEIHALSTNFPLIEFLFTGSKELDITDKNAIQQLVNEFKPDIVINCAAYTAVDKAEDEIEEADAVNHLAVKNLAEICKSATIRLIHISTDYVFNGQANRPYKETDPTDPINEYGRSKLKGEQAIINTGVQATIIRTSWVYSSFGNNFVKTMIRLGQEKDEINVVADQFGSPTNAKDLAVACLQIASSPEKWEDGSSIFHYSNDGEISWYDFAKEIMVVNGLKCKVSPISTDEYPTKAKRPRYTVLLKSNIKEIFNFESPNWCDSLKNYLH